MTWQGEHIDDCKDLLDKGWTVVHMFLDQMTKEFAPSRFGEYHRTFYHNSYGLTIIEHKWGPEGKAAGLIHLYRDYLEAPIAHKGLETVIGKALLKMPWWDNVEYADTQWYNLEGDG